MKVLKRGVTPKGIRIQVEDLTDGLCATIQIAAYPPVRTSEDECFRIALHGKTVTKSVMELFVQLESGKLQIEDFEPWFERVPRRYIA